jgi:hypothetical protein
MGAGGVKAGDSSAVPVLLGEFLVGGRKKRKRVLLEKRAEILWRKKQQAAEEQAVLLQALLAQSRGGLSSLKTSRQGGSNGYTVEGGGGREPRWKRLVQNIPNVGHEKKPPKKITMAEVMQSMHTGHRPKWRLVAQGQQDQAVQTAKARQQAGLVVSGEFDMSLAQEEAQIRTSVNNDPGLSSSDGGDADRDGNDLDMIARQLHFQSEVEEVRSLLERQQRHRARDFAQAEAVRLVKIEAQEWEKAGELQELQRKFEEQAGKKKTERKTERRAERKRRREEAREKGKEKGEEKEEEKDGETRWQEHLQELAEERKRQRAEHERTLEKLEKLRLEHRAGLGDGLEGETQAEGAKGLGAAKDAVGMKTERPAAGLGKGAQRARRSAGGKTKLAKQEVEIVQSQHVIAELEYAELGTESRFYKLEKAKFDMAEAKRAARLAREGEERRQRMVARRCLLDGVEGVDGNGGGKESGEEEDDESSDADESSGDDEDNEDETGQEKSIVMTAAAELTGAGGSFSLLEARAKRVRQLRVQAKAKAGGMFDSIFHEGTEWERQLWSAEKDGGRAGTGEGAGGGGSNSAGRVKNGEVYITRDDHMRLFVRAGLVDLGSSNDDSSTAEAVDARFDAVDADGDGRVTRQQFVAGQVPSVMQVLLKLEERGGRGGKEEQEGQEEQEEQDGQHVYQTKGGTHTTEGKESGAGLVVDVGQNSSQYRRPCEGYSMAGPRVSQAPSTPPAAPAAKIAPKYSPTARAREKPSARAEGVTGVMVGGQGQLLVDLAAAKKAGSTEEVELAMRRAGMKQQALLMRQRLMRQNVLEDEKRADDEAASRQIFAKDVEATRAKLQLIKCEHAVRPTGTRQQIVANVADVMMDAGPLIIALEKEDRAEIALVEKEREDVVEAARAREAEAAARRWATNARAKQLEDKYGRSMAHTSKKEGNSGGAAARVERMQAKEAVRRHKHSKEERKKRRQRLEQEKYEREERGRAEERVKKQVQMKAREFEDAMDAGHTKVGRSSKGRMAGAKTKRGEQEREAKRREQVSIAGTKPHRRGKTRFPRLTRS